MSAITLFPDGLSLYVQRLPWRLRHRATESPQSSKAYNKDLLAKFADFLYRQAD